MNEWMKKQAELQQNNTDARISIVCLYAAKNICSFVFRFFSSFIQSIFVRAFFPIFYCMCLSFCLYIFVLFFIILLSTFIVCLFCQIEYVQSTFHSLIFASHFGLCLWKLARSINRYVWLQILLSHRKRIPMPYVDLTAFYRLWIITFWNAPMLLFPYYFFGRFFR